MLTEGENVPLTLGDNEVDGILEGLALAEGVNDNVGWLDGAVLTEGSELTLGDSESDGDWDGCALTEGIKDNDGLVEGAILTEGDNVPLIMPKEEIEGLTLEVGDSEVLGDSDSEGEFDGCALAEGVNDNDG